MKALVDNQVGGYRKAGRQGRWGSDQKGVHSSFEPMVKICGLLYAVYSTSHPVTHPVFTGRAFCNRAFCNRAFCSKFN